MTINAVGLAQPYSPTKNDALDARTFDFLPHGGKDEDENEDGVLNNRTSADFDLENAVLKANSCSAVLQKLAATPESISTEFAPVGQNVTLTFGNVLSVAQLMELFPPGNPASIYDIPPGDFENLAFHVVPQIISRLDTTGLTNAEIYSKIESIFTAYFGSDFLEASAIMRGAWHSGAHEGINWVSTQFSSMLESRGIGQNERAEALKEIMGFKGMSDNEIREAVRARFPSVMTYREVLIMAREFFHLGVDDGICVGFHVSLGVEMNVRSKMESDSSWEDYDRALRAAFDRLLNSPANYNSLLKAAENFNETKTLKHDPQITAKTFEETFSHLDEVRLNAMKRKMEELLEEMEEYMINVLTRSADDSNWLEEAFAPEAIPTNL
jgi:hypothetical protein